MKHKGINIKRKIIKRKVSRESEEVGSKMDGKRRVKIVSNDTW